MNKEKKIEKIEALRCSKTGRPIIGNYVIRHHITREWTSYPIYIPEEEAIIIGVHKGERNNDI